MALIKCTECGKEVSDKAHACIHCGFPLKELRQKEKKDVGLFKVELIDIRDKKAKAQMILKKYCNMDVYEIFDLLKNLPQIVYEGDSKKTAVLISQEFINYDIVFRVYEGEEEIQFDLVPQEGIVNSQIQGVNKIKCPSCGKMIDETARRCPSCGFDGISSYLLSQMKESTLDDVLTAKCPTCGSGDVRKIKASEKVGNFVLFGLFGNRRKKQFHCNNCQYEW